MLLCRQWENGRHLFFLVCVAGCHSLICLSVSVDDAIGGGVKCLVGFDRALVVLIVRHYLRSFDS